VLRGPRPEHGRPLRILLVEDNLDHVVITRQAVASILPCEVEVVQDGAKAAARLADTSPTRARPDLILLDLHLPAMSGLEVLRRLRSNPAYDSTPVIVLTAAGDDENAILECYANGANSFLPKPATDKRFAEALELLVRAAPSLGSADSSPV
jgi:two-component system, response regulator